MGIISNASSHQIKAAIDYNRNEVNKLLIQLLTINFIKTHEKAIQNETKRFQEKSDPIQLENYCNHSEIAGNFSHICIH